MSNDRRGAKIKPKPQPPIPPPVVPPPVPPVVPPTPAVTEQSILAMLSSNTPNVRISFGYAERNYDNAGRPVNIYRYGKGHGDGLLYDNSHPGIDVWMPDETPVRSLGAGKVVCVGNHGPDTWGQGCGYFSDDNGGIGNITILHDMTALAGGKRRPLKITYGHMSSAAVSLGSRVTLGQVIGKSGKGGDWPHVHLDTDVEANELNNPAIWNNPGAYHLLNPIPTLIEAMTRAGQPTVPPVVPPTTGLVMPVATLPFTTATPFRATGGMSAARVAEILNAVDSPMAPEAAAIAAATPGMTALPLAQSYKESRYGIDESARATRNPLGLLWYPGMVPSMPTNDTWGVPLIVFPDYAAAFREYFRRMTDPAYKNGIYMPREMTLERMIRIYVAGAGPGYANGESAASVNLYLGQTKARLNRYNGLVDPDPIWGPSTSVPGLAIPLKTMWVPVGARNRPGFSLTGGAADWVTIHETANPNLGANARMHAQFLRDGGGSESVSFHLSVDDREAWQMLPFDEGGYHAGDGCDNRSQDLGCFDSIAIETCINSDGDFAKTKANLVELVSWLILGGGGPNLSSQRVRQHNAWSGKDCPHIIRSSGQWDTLMQQIVAKTGGR